eukprot:GFYU01022358.1.p1 GENE.GFYU01022358.1~~GFYU01022358.1.p1  ORF type:complete len:116 (-),score=24.05 GFYU01022358.1:82-429(-)
MSQEEPDKPVDPNDHVDAGDGNVEGGVTGAGDALGDDGGGGYISPPAEPEDFLNVEEHGVVDGDGVDTAAAVPIVEDGGGVGVDVDVDVAVDVAVAVGGGEGRRRLGVGVVDVWM